MFGEFVHHGVNIDRHGSCAIFAFGAPGNQGRRFPPLAPMLTPMALPKEPVGLVQLGGLILIVVGVALLHQ